MDYISDKKMDILKEKIKQAGQIIDDNGITLILNWVKGNMYSYSSLGYGSHYFDNGRQVINKYMNHLEYENNKSGFKAEKGIEELVSFCDKVINGEDNIPVPFTICI